MGDHIQGTTTLGSVGLQQKWYKEVFKPGDDFSSGCHCTVVFFPFKNRFSYQLGSLHQDIFSPVIIHTIRFQILNGFVIPLTVVTINKLSNHGDIWRAITLIIGHIQAMTIYSIFVEMHGTKLLPRSSVLTASVSGHRTRIKRWQVNFT